MNEQLIGLWNKITEKLSGWLESAVMLIPNFILALLVLGLAILIGNYLRKLIRLVLIRLSVNKSLVSWAGTGGRIAIILLGTFAALEILHLDKAVTSLLAGAGIIGLAISFAFQDVAQNLVSGLYLAIRRPIKLGDIVETADYMGEVRKIGIRNSVLRTFDGQDLHLPNKYLFQEAVLNYSTGSRRIVLRTGVSYGDDLDQVESVTMKAMSALDTLDPSKEVQVYFEEFGDSSIQLRIHLWIRYCQQGPYFSTLSEAIKRLHQAYQQAGITIPFPIRTIDFDIKGGKSLGQMMRKVDMMPSSQN